MQNMWGTPDPKEVTRIHMVSEHVEGRRLGLYGLVPGSPIGFMAAVVEN